MRLFVAAVPPVEIRRSIAAGARDWLHSSPAVRRVPEHNLHLTLAFLGEQDTDRLAPITEVLQEVTRRMAHFRLQPGEWERFPARGRPRVYWLGLRPCPPLLALAGHLRSALSEYASDLDGRRFSPHLTVARVRRGGRRPLPMLAPERSPSFEWRVGEVELIRSRLGQGPARYTTLEQMPLPLPPEEG